MRLDDVPVADAHCHLIFPNYEDHELSSVLSLSLEGMPHEQTRAALLYMKVLSELAHMWWGDTARADDVLKERHRRMTADYPEYVRSLFQDVRLEYMVVDLGYKPASVPINDFERVVPAKVAYLFRIESVLDDMWKRKVAFEEAEAAFRDAVDDAMREGHKGLKTIIGYRTGLDITKVSRKEAARAWEETDEKPVRDYFMGVTIEKCGQYECPLQVHTAFGESNIDLRNNNPLHLKAFLERDEVRKVPLVLVHGGYPYSFEAGYLSAMYPNVYVDLSEGIPWVALEAKSILQKVLSMAPLNKVMFGSDGFIIPEISWIAARMMKHSLADLLGEMVRERFIPVNRAEDIACDILGRTVRRLYWGKETL